MFDASSLSLVDFIGVKRERETGDNFIFVLDF